MAKAFMTLKFSEGAKAKLMADLTKFGLNTRAGAKKVLMATATNIMAQSQSEVPRDTETLRSTAYIEQPKETLFGVSIKLGYGGEKDKMNPVSKEMASEYAMKVHEIPGTSPGGGNYHPYGKWKYLEEPAIAHKEAFREAFKTEMQVVTSKGMN